MEEQAQTKEDGQKSSKKSTKEKTVKLTEEEHDQLLEELKEYKDKYIRLCAEFDNARKRMQREKEEFVKFANEGLILDFLTILDHLELSVSAARSKHEDYEAFLKGIEMVTTQTYELLKKNGLKPIETKDKMFDPNYHEILSQEETDQVEDGLILEEFQKGYCLGDRVIRTAKVKIAQNTKNKITNNE